MQQRTNGKDSLILQGARRSCTVSELSTFKQVLSATPEIPRGRRKEVQSLFQPKLEELARHKEDPIQESCHPRASRVQSFHSTQIQGTRNHSFHLLFRW